MVFSAIIVLQKLRLSPQLALPKHISTPGTFSLEHWKFLVERAETVKSVTRVGIVGKYTGSNDSYLSVVKALEHAAIEIGAKLELVWVESTDLEKEGPACTQAMEKLKSVQGVLCPGGFGDRGIEGLIVAANHCRTQKIPFFGICLGMQIAVIEFCRNVLGLANADSEEFNPETKHKVVIFMPEINSECMGGTMRLGNRATIVRDRNSLTSKLYDNEPVIYERHRHRYEVNPDYVGMIQSRGLRFVGQDERAQRMEIIELEGHPFFLASQYHPEFTSRPIRPNPCILGFVLATAGKLQER